MSLKIMQGDQYAIVFTGVQDGAPLDLSKIEMIEFIVGKLRKIYPGEVTANDGKFYFPLTQEETMNFKSAMQSVQIRVKFLGAEPVVVGVPLGGIRVTDAISKVVLGWRFHSTSARGRRSPFPLKMSRLVLAAAPATSHLRRSTPL